MRRVLFGAIASCVLPSALPADLNEQLDLDASSLSAAPKCDSETADPVGLFKRGSSLVSPYMLLSERPQSVAQQHSAEVRTGIACLDKAIQLRPDYWQALWVRGKAYQALGEHRAAADSFRTAYDLNPDNPDVGRELVLAYTDQGKIGEALPIAKALADSHPKDAGLRANYALVLVLVGQIRAAQATIADALTLDPSDAVTRVLKTRIDDVASGKRARPKSVHDLER